MMADARGLLTRYLLDELSPEEQRALEERYTGDPRSFDEVVRVENDLVDDYVRGKLEPRVRERFERAYLAHPRRRERVRFAEALLTRVDRSADAGVATMAPSFGGRGWRTWPEVFLAPKPALGFAFAILLVASAVWLATEGRSSRREAATLESRRTDEGRRERGADVRIDKGKAPADRSAPPPVVFAIRVGSGVRAADPSPPAPIVMPPGTTEVRLRFSVEGHEYRSYRVILRDVGSTERLRRDQLAPTTAGSEDIVTLDVPARELESGDYVLTLQGASGAGFEDLSRSLIRVDKR